MLIILGLWCLISATTAQSYSEFGTVDGKTPGEISKQKCREYAKYVYDYRPSPLLLPANNNSTLLKLSTCGIFNDRFIGNYSKAKIREFPHQAVIGYEITPGEIAWRCSGSLISENYIITAGHCLLSRLSGAPKYVKMGILHINDISSMQMRKVTQVINHPDYRPPSVYNDIGLLKLETGFNLNGYVRPACLFTPFDIPPQKAIVSGWGRPDFTESTLSEHLLKVALDLVDTEKCNKLYKLESGSKRLKNGIEGDLQMCAGFSGKDNKVTYVGQGGAPLQIYHHGDDLHCMYDIIGVTSFGRHSLYYPEVYTRISRYIPWIESVVWS